ncbi:MAG: hypothetical protein ACLUE7_01135 [Lachnospirales bacterium]
MILSQIVDNNGQEYNNTYSYDKVGNTISVSYANGTRTVKYT